MYVNVVVVDSWGIRRFICGSISLWNPRVWKSKITKNNVNNPDLLFFSSCFSLLCDDFSFPCCCFNFPVLKTKISKNFCVYGMCVCLKKKNTGNTASEIDMRNGVVRRRSWCIVGNLGATLCYRWVWGCLWSRSPFESVKIKIK